MKIIPYQKFLTKYFQLKYNTILMSNADENFPPDFFECRYFSESNVTAGLEPRFREWSPDHPVFIDAGTGCGKSHFVLNSLIPWVEENMGSILIVTNRIALTNQYKVDFLKRVGFNALAGVIPEKEGPVTLGVVTFSSYQSLPSIFKQQEDYKAEPYSMVVFDECHWFGADALFARNTGWILSKIPPVFQKSIRVYMSATPWLSRFLIVDNENQLPLPLLNRMEAICNRNPLQNLCFSPQEQRFRMLYYSFPPVLRHYNLKILPSSLRRNLCRKELCSLIESTKPSEKWLIFVESKTQGAALADTLTDAVYLDANRKDGPVWNQVTQESKFSSRILISTSVLDCGVNLHDDALKHILILSTDHTCFMQELGRKRMKKGEVVNLYIPDLSQADLKKMQAQNASLMQRIMSFPKLSPKEVITLKMRLWEETSTVERHIFPLNPAGDISINPCASWAIFQRDLFYQNLQKAFDSGEEHPFPLVVNQWLGITAPLSPDQFLEDRPEDHMQALTDFLSKHLGKELATDDEQTTFADTFRLLRNKAYGKRKNDNVSRHWGSRIINGEFTDLQLPFSLKENGSSWILKSASEL